MAASPRYGQAFAHEAITVTGTPIGPTALTVYPDHDQKPRPGFEGFFTVETDAIRYTVDGTTPSNTVGHIVAAGSNFTVTGTNNLLRLKMAKVTNNATVMATYFR